MGFLLTVPVALALHVVAHEPIVASAMQLLRHTWVIGLHLLLMLLPHETTCGAAGGCRVCSPGQ